MTIPGSAGALLTRPHQYEIGNGTSAWLWGSGTPNQVESVEGLFTLPSMRDEDVDRQDSHGSFPGVDLLSKRRIIFVVNLLNDDLQILSWEPRQQDLSTRLNLCHRWLQPSASDLVLAWRQPWFGNAHGYKDFWCKVRPKRRALPDNADLAAGHGVLTAELHAADPRIYALTPQTTHIDTAIGSPNGSAILLPAGESPSYPVYTITGPAHNPSFANSDDSNRQFFLTVTMVPTDVLVIDTLTKSVLLNGVQRWDLMTSGSWHKLIPQTNNHITYTQTNSGAATHVDITFYDAWL